MTSIWHISDIHIRNGYYEDIQYAIDLLAAIIKKNTEQKNLLVIAGDVFESKTKVSSADLECFHQIIQKLNFVKILIIPGNHDISGPDSVDLVSAALLNKYQHVYLFNKSGTYQIPDIYIDFHILLPNTDYNEFFHLAPNKLQAAILHEPIRGCKLYGSVTIDTQARFNVSDLEKFHFVMLGDIHQPQYLGKTQKIAYSGSLVQKNKAEGLLHGYIRWQINNWDVTSSFHYLPLYSAFLTLTAENDTVKYPDPGLFLKAKYVELRYTNCPCLDTLISEIHKKYGRLDNIIHIDNKKEEISLTSHSMEPDSLHKLLTEQLNDHPLKDRILGVHEQLYNSISDGIGSIKQKWRLNFLSWSNMFCYGENNHIDFTKLTGVISLIGKNKTGKSSILDVLVLALYNELLRGDRKSIIRAGAPSYKIACGFSNSDAEYIIQREGKNNSGNQINIYKLTERKPGEDWKDISGVDINSTYEKIRKIIGNYQDLTNINIALQENVLIVNKKPDEQVSEFRKYFSLDKLESIELTVKEKIKELKQAAKLKKADLEKSGVFEILDDDNFNVKIDTISNELEKIFGEIKRLTEHKDNLNKKLFPIKMTLEECQQQIENTTPSQHTKEFLLGEIDKLQQRMPDIVKSFDKEIDSWQEKKIQAAKRALHAPQETEIENIYTEIGNTVQKYEKSISALQNKKQEMQKKINPVKTVAAVNTEKTIKEYEDLLSKSEYNEDLVKLLEKDITLLENRLTKVTDKIKNLEKLVDYSSEEKSDEDINLIRQQLASFSSNVVKAPLMQDKNAILEKLQRFEKQYQTLSYLPIDKLEIDIELTQNKNTNEKEKEDRFYKLEKDLQILHKYNFARGTTELKLNLGLKATLSEYQKLADYKQILDKLTRGYDPELATALKFEASCECCKFNQNVLKSNIDHMMQVINDMYYYKSNELVRLAYILTEQYKIWLARWQYEECQEKYKILHNQEMIEDIKKLETEQEQLTNQLAEKTNQKKQQLEFLQKDREYKQCLNFLKFQKIQKRNEEIMAIITELDKDTQTLILEKDENINILQQKLTEKQQEKAKFLSEQEIRLNEEIATIEKSLQGVMRKRDSVIKKLTQELQLFQNSIKNIDIWEDLQEKKKKLEFNASINKKLDLIENELTKLFNIRDSSTSKIQEYKVALSKVKFFKEMQQEIMKIDEEKQVYDEYLKKINMKTGIPFNILSKSCHDLEADMNEMLNTITDFKIKLQFDTKKFKITLAPNNIPAEQGSGFQKFIIDLVLRICLCKNHPILPTFLIIDEGFGCMDKTHLDNTKELFHLLELTKKFDYIIVISHLEELQTMTNKKITIEQKDGFSYINIGKQFKLPEIKIDEPPVTSDTVISIVNGKNFCHICNKQLLRTTPEKHLSTKAHECLSRKAAKR